METKIRKNQHKNPEFTTAICNEQPLANNPFVAQTRSIKGYDSQDLWRNASYMDVLLLHFLADLPTPGQRQQLEMLFIGLMNLGPREVENRSAMIAGVSRTRPEHLLSIGLLAGECGANDVKQAYEFLESNASISPQQCLSNCLNKNPNSDFLAPGMGHSYGAIDPLLQKLANDIFALNNECPIFQWCRTFANLLNEHEQGWLAPGLTAGVCLSLGINAQNALGIYQLAKSVGIVAYAMEQTRLPMSKAPFLSDEFYEQSNQL